MMDWSEVDKHILKNRIFKEIDIDEYIQESDQKIEGIRGALPEPEIEPELRDFAVKKDWGRPWYGNDYMFCPEMYCAAVKRRLGCEICQFFENYPDGVPEKPWYTVFPPADLVKMHDAVFVDDEKLELVDPLPEKKKRNWWDKEAIAAEFGFNPMDYSASKRVDFYLEETRKNEKA